MVAAFAAARALLHARDVQDVTAPHETRASAVLRPVVFGANDGLVSNLALVMGVAGASAEPGIIVLAGIAGLLAGAFSMGVGEYISVQSQRELLEYQLAFQRRQLLEVPEQERRIWSRPTSSAASRRRRPGTSRIASSPTTSTRPAS